MQRRHVSVDDNVREDAGLKQHVNNFSSTAGSFVEHGIVRASYHFSVWRRSRAEESFSGGCISRKTANRSMFLEKSCAVGRSASATIAFSGSACAKNS